MDFMGTSWFLPFKLVEIFAVLLVCIYIFLKGGVSCNGIIEWFIDIVPDDDTILLNTCIQGCRSHTCSLRY